MRVLVVRVGAMGDVLHALPAVSALRQALPSAEIGWVIEPRWQALLRDQAGRAPLVNSVHLAETSQWKQSPLSVGTLRSLATLRDELRGRSYDVCLDLQGSLRSAMIGRVAGASRFVGSSSPRERPAALFYKTRVSASASHVVEQAAELVAAAIGEPLRPAAVELPRDAAAEAWWAERWQPAGSRPFALLVPQAGWGAKQWPADRMGAVARALHAGGYTVFVNEVRSGANRASGSDRLAAAVLAAAGATAQGVHADLAQLIALTRRAALVIAGDTGPLHLAAALHRPVLALFGPTDPARTGPYGTRARVLRQPTSVTDHSRHQATEEGLLQISADDVIAAANELLQEAAGRETEVPR